jgi:hypothetical protein
MFKIHPLAAGGDKVAEMQHLSMKYNIVVAHTEGLFCVLYAFRRITYFPNACAQNTGYPPYLKHSVTFP